jgi:threonine dehydrogenase-like Zn-dependent dehydrogenase
MRQLSYMRSGRLVVEDAPVSEVGEGEVRVRVHSVGICKSDVYGYSGLNDRRDAVLTGDEVLVMGHEASGVIAELGPGVSWPPVGTHVAVNPIYGCGHCALCASGNENLCTQRTVLGCAPDAPGAFADTITVPARSVVALSGDTSLELAALVEPLTVGFHAVRLANLMETARVLVIGGGIVGLGAALAARRATLGEIVVVEPLADRRELIARLGLSAAAPEEIDGLGQFDVALECVARPETFAAAIRAVGRRGLVVLVGIFDDFIPLPVSEVVGAETQIMGSYGYSHSDFADVAHWVQRRDIDLGPIIENRVGFDGVIGAFESYADGSLNAIRTLFQP